MVARGEVGADPSPDGGDDKDELDAQRLGELGGFLLRAPRRHPRTAVACICLTLSFGVLVAVLWPRSYRCDVRILVQNNLVLPALGNPTRAVPHDADAPTTKNAADAILRRDNVVAMIEQLGLLHRWQATRQPIHRLKDKIMGVSNDDDDGRMRDMIEVLTSRLTVTSDDSTITVSIEWPDRETAFEILSFVQKNFLEARYHNNVNVIAEAIRILDERSKPQAAEVDTALAELLQCESDRNEALRDIDDQRASRQAARRSPGGGRDTPAVPARAAARAPGPGGHETDYGTIAEELQSVRRRAQLVMEDHDRQRSEAQRQLIDARATLGPLHPTVVALNDKIDRLSEPAPGLEELDARERGLVAKLAAAAARPPAAARDGSPPPAASRALATAPASALPVDIRDDTRTALARAKLQTASTKYSEALSRIEAAKLELDVARAAFKFHYAVVRPPELPRRPSKPNVRLVLLVSAALSILMALLVPAGVDFRRGRFVEAWQIERKLGLPILGRLPPPS